MEKTTTNPLQSKEESLSNNKTQIGLFGFGCVGQGLFDVINESQNLKANIKQICVKNKNKDRSIDSSYFTYDKQDILNRKDLDVIVELIDNADDAFSLVSSSLSRGINVVSANKKLIAENFKELLDLQIDNRAGFLYEGAVAGSIPIIRTIEEYYDNELLSSIKGILNGSTNYILTKMEVEGSSYANILKEAQEIGFAEADPWLDVAGFDPKYKISILTAHGFGVIVDPKEVLNLGIQNISAQDIKYAQEKDLRIKLIASAYRHNGKLRVYVLPTFVDLGSQLSNINYEYNAVEIEGAFSDKQTFVGKGAGSHPTGSAVLSDISALTYDYKYSYKKLIKNLNAGNAFEKIDSDFHLKVFVRFEDKEHIKKLKVIEVEESFTSKESNYIVATVEFSSLFHFYDNKKSSVFIAELPK